MEGRRRQDRHVPHGGDHGPPSRPDRRARGKRARACRRRVHARSTQQVARAPRGAWLSPGRKGKTGYLHGRAFCGPSGRSTRSSPSSRNGASTRSSSTRTWNRCRASSRRRTGACTPPSTRASLPRAAVDVEPEPAGDPDPDRARPGRSGVPSWRKQGTACSPPTTHRSNCASSRTSPASRSSREAFARGEDIHAATAAGGHREGTGDAHEGRAQRRQDGELRDHLWDLGVRAV